MRRISAAIISLLPILLTACNVDPTGKDGRRRRPRPRPLPRPPIRSRRTTVSRRPRSSRSPTTGRGRSCSFRSCSTGSASPRRGRRDRGAVHPQCDHGFPGGQRAAGDRRSRRSHPAGAGAVEGHSGHPHRHDPGRFRCGSVVPLPAAAADQAKLPALGYETLDEKIAERFHTTVDTLLRLNPLPGTVSPAAFRRCDATPSSGQCRCGHPPHRLPPASGRQFDPRAQRRRRPDRSRQGRQRCLAGNAAHARRRHAAAARRADRRQQIEGHAQGLRRFGQAGRHVHRDDGLAPRSAAAGRVEGQRRRPQSEVPLQSEAVLGRVRQRRQAAAAAGPERPGRRRLDRPQQAALRHSRHARARDHRPGRKPRLRAADQLGRGAAGANGPLRGPKCFSRPEPADITPPSGWRGWRGGYRKGVEHRRSRRARAQADAARPVRFRRPRGRGRSDAARERGEHQAGATSASASGSTCRSAICRRRCSEPGWPCRWRWA